MERSIDRQSVPLGKRIAAVRELLGWNKSELARRANVAPSYITRLEQGYFGRPSIDQIRLIADALGVNVADLTEPPGGELSPGVLGDLERLYSTEEERQLLEEAIRGLKRHSPRQQRKILEILHTLAADDAAETTP